MTEEKNIVHNLIQKIDQEPNNAENYYALATILVKQQAFDQAEELLVKAKGLFDDDEHQDLFQYGLGNVYYEAGLYEKANQTFQTIQANRYKQDANLMIAQGYFAQSQYKLAFAFALTALESDLENPAANQLMGDIELALGEIKEAKTYYDKALKKQTNAKLLFNRGVVEMTLTKDKNNQFFNQVQKLDPKFFEINKQRLIDIDKLANHAEEDN